MERSRYLILLVLLGMLTAITAFSIDPTLPSMPELAREFGIDSAAASSPTLKSVSSGMVRTT